MTHRNTLFTTILLAFWFLAFSCLVFPQKTQAVSPAPDGGYPGGNTAEGHERPFGPDRWHVQYGSRFLVAREQHGRPIQYRPGRGGASCQPVDEIQRSAQRASKQHQRVGNTATGAGALLSNTTGDEQYCKWRVRAL